jgi:putative membrane protein
MMEGYGMGFGWIFALILIVVIVWAAVRVADASRTRQGQGGYSNRNDAMEILKARYAKGEIDREEFERMKKDLA